MVAAIGRAMYGIAQAAIDPAAFSTTEMNEALDVYRSTGARFQIPFLLSLYAEASLAKGDRKIGMDAVSEAFSLIKETGEDQVVAEVYRVRGNISVVSQNGNPEGDYLRAIEISRAQGTRLFELRAALSLARLWSNQGRRSEGLSLLAPIYEWFTEGLSTTDLNNARDHLQTPVPR